MLGEGRLGLVDFGMTGALTDDDMRRLTRLLVDAVNENVDALPRRLYELGVRFNREQEEELRIELREVYYRYYGSSMGQIDPLQVIREAFVLVSRMHLRLPTRFALLDKALATLGGVGTEIYPDFNVFEVAEPYAAELVQKRYSPRRLAEQGWEGAESYTRLLMELPYQVHDTLEQSATARSRCSSGTRARPAHQPGRRRGQPARHRIIAATRGFVIGSRPTAARLGIHVLALACSAGLDRAGGAIVARRLEAELFLALGRFTA